MKKRTAKRIGLIAIVMALLGGVVTFLIFKYNAFWKYP